MANTVKAPPRWVIRLNVLMLRLGVPVGSQQLLSITGRRSGTSRHTPVSIVTIGDERYVVAAFGGAEWVKNARAAGVGLLTRGRVRQTVRVVELPVSERPAVLRAFLRQVPGGVRFFGVTADPDVLAASAAEYPVFRLDRT